MKKFILYIFLFVLALQVFAYDFRLGGVEYNIIGSDEVEVSLVPVAKTGAYSVPSTVLYSGTTYNVTKIGNRAFLNCTGLTSITIPASVSQIGCSAFKGCTSATQIILPNNVIVGDSAFYNCTALTTFAIPAAWDTIPRAAFAYCSALSRLTIPSNVHCIGMYAFYHSGLRNVTFSEGLTKIDDSAFSGCEFLTTANLPNSLTELGNYAFRSCDALTTVTIPENLLELHANSFSRLIKTVNWNAKNCTIPDMVKRPNSTEWQSVFGDVVNECNFGDSVRIIPSYLFVRSKITSITIPVNVQEIGADVFDWGELRTVQWNAKYCRCTGPYGWISSVTYCTNNINSFVFGNTVEIIGRDACYNTKGVTSIIIPNSVVRIEDNAFYNSGIKSIEIPSSVKYIGWYVFPNLTSVTLNEGLDTIAGSFGACSLTSVNLPRSLSYIGSSSFRGCKFSTIDLPNVSYIGDNAFSGSRFASIDIPSSVDTIGKNAFGTITTSIICRKDVPPVIDEGTFTNANLNVYVPCGSQSLYEQDERWSFFFNVSETFPYKYVLESNDPTLGMVTTHGTLSCTSDTVQINAIPTSYGVFDSWSDGEANPTRTITITTDTTIYALFSAKIAVIDVDSVGKGYVDGAGTYSAGSMITLTAIPNPHHHFVQWNDGCIDNPRSILVEHDSTFTAEFAIDQHTVTIIATNAMIEGLGDSPYIGQGSQCYDYGSVVEISVVPAEGYYFEKWSNEDTSNPLILTVTEDVSLKAILQPIPDGLYDTKCVGFPVKYIEDGKLRIQKGDYLYDALGNHLK